MRPGRLVLHATTVVDVLTGQLQPDVDITIDGDRITAITPAAQSITDERADHVDAAGTFAVPGFCDMHAHAIGGRHDPEPTLRLMMSAGVTSFRQMSGSRRLLAQRAEGRLSLPIDGAKPLAMPGDILVGVNAGTDRAAIREVRRQADSGADFIKVAMVTPSVFDDVTAEATRLGIAVAGHLPAGTDLRGASARAMRSIEHLGPGPSVIAACCTDEDDVRRDINSEGAHRIPSLPPALQRVMSPISSRIIERLVINPLLIGGARDASRIAAADNTFDAGRARTLARQFVADETWHCPTLIRLRTQQYADDPVYGTDPDLRYMSTGAIRRWRSAARRYAARPTDVREVYRAHYDRQLAMVAIFDQEGVPMLAGSDAGGAGWEVPGYALHREFDQLAAAGLAPLRILQMVTSNAARFLGRNATMGVVAPGRKADLVLLAADPTQDVSHLHQIVAVAHGGQYLPARRLAALAESVITAGGAH